MEFAIWILLGGALGWLGFAILKFSAGWGLMVSITIGAAGSIVEGKVLSPLIGAATAQRGDFDPLSVFIAVVGAAALLIIGNMIYDRFTL